MVHFDMDKLFVINTQLRAIQAPQTNIDNVPMIPATDVF